IRGASANGHVEQGTGLGRPEPLTTQVGQGVQSSEVSATNGKRSKVLDPGLIEFEEGILSRLHGPRDEMNEWIVWSPFSQVRIHAPARRYKRLGDVQDIASDAILALLRSLDQPSSPLLRWDRRRGSGFWPTVFRKKVRKAVEPLLRRRNRRRRVV